MKLYLKTKNVLDERETQEMYRIEHRGMWGMYALLCAADVVHEPCCVINADDYYGIDAYRTIYEELVKLHYFLCGQYNHFANSSNAAR